MSLYSPEPGYRRPLRLITCTSSLSLGECISPRAEEWRALSWSHSASRSKVFVIEMLRSGGWILHIREVLCERKQGRRYLFLKSGTQKHETSEMKLWASDLTGSCALWASLRHRRMGLERNAGYQDSRRWGESSAVSLQVVFPVCSKSCQNAMSSSNYPFLICTFLQTTVVFPILGSLRLLQHILYYN